MKIAIMQPYLFPYIGYFQLINAVDKFIFYDDVNFIKQGWINRNNILVNNQKILFSIPIEKISSYKKINLTKVNTNIFNKNKKKLIKTIEQSYKKAPYFSQIIGFIYSVLEMNSEFISDFAKKSIFEVCNYLKIDTKIINSSSIYNNDSLKSSKRVIDICNKEKVTQYINPIGGRELYSKEDFKRKNIELYFLKTKDIRYKQFKSVFFSNLSIIDVLMFNSKKEVRDMLIKFELI